MSKLKEIYTKEKQDLEEMIKDIKKMDYMKNFQEFSKPPTLPDGINNTEFYRPNPAAYQRRLNSNPYEVDVAHTAVDMPIYTNSDNTSIKLQTRANTAYYNQLEKNFYDNRMSSNKVPNIKKAFANVRGFQIKTLGHKHENVRTGNEVE